MKIGNDIKLAIAFSEKYPDAVYLVNGVLAMKHQVTFGNPKEYAVCTGLEKFTPLCEMELFI